MDVPALQAPRNGTDLRRVVDDVGTWLGVSSLGLNGAAAALSGLLWANDRLGWDSCLIATCEGNHIGSPVLLALIMTKATAMLFAAAAPLLALRMVVVAVVGRRRPSKGDGGRIGLLLLAFVTEVGLEAATTGRDAVESAVGLVRGTAVIATYASVVSGLSLAAAAYGIVSLVRGRRLARWPGLAFAWGLMSLGAAAWCWEFTDRSL